MSGTDKISATEFSRERGVRRETEWRWRKLGTAPKHEVIQVKGRSFVFYTRADIDEWLQEQASSQ